MHGGKPDNGLHGRVRSCKGVVKCKEGPKYRSAGDCVLVAAKILLRMGPIKDKAENQGKTRGKLGGIVYFDRKKKGYSPLHYLDDIGTRKHVFDKRVGIQ